MKEIVILGAGKIGRMVSHLLSSTAEYRLRLGDSDPANLEQASRGLANLSAIPTDFASAADLDRILQGAAAVVSCAPYTCNALIAARAREKRAHYFDLTEDVRVTRQIQELAVGAQSAFMPQCGLAPGFIAIAGMHVARGFADLHELKLRVGALPRRPGNQLQYNLTWSTHGLVNEYCNPCDALIDGKAATTEPLEGLEKLTLQGVVYEAFNTSGGLGTLAQTLAGKVRNLNYKTIRYPGHNQLMRFLLHELRFREHKDELVRILDRAIPHTLEDEVVVHVSATGTAATTDGNAGPERGRLVERTYTQVIPDRTIAGQRWGAIQVTTAAGVSAVVDLLLQGRLPQSGFVRQEQVEMREFLANRFGSYYATA